VDLSTSKVRYGNREKGDKSTRDPYATPEGLVQIPPDWDSSIPSKKAEIEKKWAEIVWKQAGKRSEITPK